MAPTSSSDPPISLLSTKDRHKLRKPAVERMRRDHINSCIKQLKLLLENESHRQDPNAKLEKSDVLEMAVVFLKHQLHPQSAITRAPLGDRYSRCWKETLHFLSTNSQQEVTPPDLQYLHTTLAANSTQALSSHNHVQVVPKQLAGHDRAVWRPR